MSSSTDRDWERRLGTLYPLVVAIQFLTRLPVPRDLDPEPEDLADCVVWFPVVGGLVGALLGGLARALLATPLVPGVSAALVVVGGVVLTGAFHEDALGDATDGLIGAWRRDRVLTIMRDSRVGTYATLALVSLMALRLVALAGTDPQVWPAVLLVAHVAGRTSALPLLGALPYARGDGENPGVGKVLVPAQTPARVTAAVTAGAGLCYLAGSWSGLAAAVAAGTVCSITTGLYYRHKIGGMTGDCLGATNTLVEVSVLLIFATLHPATSSAWVAAG